MGALACAGYNGNGFSCRSKNCRICQVGGAIPERFRSGTDSHLQPVKPPSTTAELATSFIRAGAQEG